MSEIVQAGIDENLERQNRFVADNLRRIFVQIYRIVGNVADAQDLTQETFIKALQRQDQLKDELKATTGCRASRPTRRSIFCAAMAGCNFASSNRRRRYPGIVRSRLSCAPNITNIWRTGCAC